MKMKNLKKKALAFAGVLALLGAGAVFGQDADTDTDETAAAPAAAPAGLDVAGGKLTIGAYINTGVRFDSVTTKASSSADSVTNNYIRPWGLSVNNSGRAQVDLGWTSGDSTYGANIRLRANKIFDAAPGLFVPYYAYGWYKPIQYFSVLGGIVDDAAFATEGDVGDYTLDVLIGPAPGGSFHLTPLKILDLGFGVYAPTDQGKGPVDYGSNVIYTAGVAVNTSAANLRGSAVFQRGFQDALFSVSLGLVENLTLALEGNVFDQKTGDESNLGFWGDLNTAYSLGDLGVSLVVYYYGNDYKKSIYGYDNWFAAYYGTNGNDYWGYPLASGPNDNTYPLDFSAKLGGTYSLLDGKVVPGLILFAGLGNNSETKDSITRIQVEPYVGFPVGNGQITFGYLLTSDTQKHDGNEGQSSLAHTIALDFLFKY